MLTFTRLFDPLITDPCRYGNCVPYRAQEKASPCDDLYTSGVDYVFVPFSRYKGKYSMLMKSIVIFGPQLLSGFDKCYDIAKRVICHFYLPPCGNTTSFETPTSVCEDTCHAVQDACGTQWESVKRFLDIFFGADHSLAFIDCDDTGRHLDPISHKCSTMDIGGVIMNILIINKLLNIVS